MRSVSFIRRTKWHREEHTQLLMLDPVNLWIRLDMGIVGAWVERVHVHWFVCIWRSEVHMLIVFLSHSITQSLSTFFFVSKSLTEPGAQRCVDITSPVSSRIQLCSHRVFCQSWDYRQALAFLSPYMIIRTLLNFLWLLYISSWMGYGATSPLFLICLFGSFYGTLCHRSDISFDLQYLWD